MSGPSPESLPLATPHVVGHLVTLESDALDRQLVDGRVDVIDRKVQALVRGRFVVVLGVDVDEARDRERRLHS
jgi:hypothetical protein